MPTANQLRYWQLQEQKRSNLENERINQEKVDVAAREATVKETKLPEEIKNLTASTWKTQQDGLLTELKRMEEQINAYAAQARVDMGDAQKTAQRDINEQKAGNFEKVAKGIASIIKAISGLGF